MKKDYKIDDIYKALDNIVRNNPQQKSISIEKLEKGVRMMRTPVIYNIDLMITDLEKHIQQNHKDNKIIRYTEKEVCKILKVKKLSLYQWRKRGLISCIRFGDRTLRYDLNKLYDDLIAIKNKNIPIIINKL